MIRLESGRVPVRGTELAMRGRGHSYHLTGTFGSPLTLDWRGTQVRLGSGDLVLTDRRRIQPDHDHRGCALVDVEMSPAWAGTWLQDPENFAGTRIPGDAGWGVALSALVSQLGPQASGASPWPTQAVADNLGTLLALVESEIGAPSLSRSDHERHASERAKDAIRHGASRPGLTAAMVAATINQSERTLHRGLAAVGETFAGFLLRCRIETARRMLEAANFRRLTTGEIGRRAGFADPSYFVRAATPHLGMTPSRYRARWQQSLAG